ncbi:TetR/AcrR family transcriptional regulator [Streptomyces sp. N2-109]|uniref:TetR/AcrR family transcriptional regulator n=1 Tax=Streptomyces gossypii TaxID=2883101 RepID=A0ABT2JQP2_9ACTN|nr:TetR/AcrR family transcriptional regulator [Streptomyces gossypii]MCT2590180.1 TetR/AcrR family transcriptional regulator [Streptomyces gossypii]
MNHEEARTRLLDAAGRLFYERGIQAVSMDELRAASGVSLKRLYQCFPAKHDLVEDYLLRRDARWRAELADYVARQARTPEDGPLVVFDWLHTWFTAPDFRGCAFINAFGELGAVSDAVTRAARHHKLAVLEYLTDLVRVLPVRDPAELAGQLVLLVDGSITAAAMTGAPSAALRARTAGAILVAAAATTTAATATAGPDASPAPVSAPTPSG